jgi:hypothetical protein
MWMRRAMMSQRTILHRHLYLQEALSERLRAEPVEPAIVKVPEMLSLTLLEEPMTAKIWKSFPLIHGTLMR